MKDSDTGVPVGIFYGSNIFLGILLIIGVVRCTTVFGRQRAEIDAWREASWPIYKACKNGEGRWDPDEMAYWLDPSRPKDWRERSVAGRKNELFELDERGHPRIRIISVPKYER